MVRTFRVAGFACILSASLLDAVLLEHDVKQPSKQSMARINIHDGGAKKPAMNIGFREFDENKDGKMSRYEYTFALVKMTRAELQQEEDRKSSLDAKEMRTKRCEAESKRSVSEKKAKLATEEHKVWQEKTKRAEHKKVTAGKDLDKAKDHVKETLKKDGKSSLLEAEEEEPSDNKFVAQCSEEEMQGATELKVEEASAAVRIAGASVEVLESKVKEVLEMWAKEKIHHHEEEVDRAKEEHAKAKEDLKTKRTDSKEADAALKKRTEAVEKLG